MGWWGSSSPAGWATAWKGAIPGGRVLVAALALLGAAAAFVPAVLSRSYLVGLPLMTAGAFGLAAATPPISAGRLQVMPPGLWGRAEAIQGVLRQIGDSFGPFAFGFAGDRLAGGGRPGLAELVPGHVGVPGVRRRGPLVRFAHVPGGCAKRPHCGQPAAAGGVRPGAGYPLPPPSRRCRQPRACSTNHVITGMAIERLMSTASATCRLLSPAGLVTAASSITGSASEVGRPDDDVPTT